MLAFCVSFLLLEVISKILCVLQPEKVGSKNCINEITDKYFDYPPTVAIFTTNNMINSNRISEIYNLKNISTKLKDYINFETDFSEHQKKFAIVASETLKEILFYETQLSKIALWNAKAGFIFVTTKSNSEIELEIFVKALWNKYIINAIIITPRDEKTMDIYSYYPFSKECGKNIKHELISSCENGVLQNDVNLFPNKIPDDLQGCLVKIRALIWPPYILMPQKEIKDHDNVDFEEGIEIILTKTIAKHANFSINYSISPIPQDWGLIAPNGTATGSMKALITKKADLAIGSIGPSVERHMFLDYAYCHLQEGLTCCVPKAQLLPKWRNLLDTFHTFTWIALIVTYVIISVTVWLVCNITPKDMTSFVFLGNAFTFIFSIFLSVSAKEVPKKRSGRILFFVWIIFALHFVIAYQAKLISVLTHPSFEKQMDSVEEMLNSDIPLVLLSTIRRFFGNTDDWRVAKILKNWNSCLDSDKCLSRIAYHRNLAFFTTKIHMEFETLKYVDQNGRPLIYCFENNYLTYPSEIFMTRGFPLRDRISTLITRIRDSGLMFKWQADIARIWKHRVAKKNTGSDDRNIALTISHLQGAFFVSSIGWLVSIFTFFVERFMSRFCKNKTK